MNGEEERRKNGKEKKREKINFNPQISTSYRRHIVNFFYSNSCGFKQALFSASQMKYALNYLCPRVASHFAEAIRTEYDVNWVGLAVGDDETSIWMEERERRENMVN